MIDVGLLLLKSSLLLAVGWCVSRLLHRASASVRHLVWLTVILGVLVIPVVGEVAPVPFRVLPAAVVASVPTADVASTLDQTAARTASPNSPVAPWSEAHIQRAYAFSRIDVGTTLIVTWASVALLLSLRLLFGVLTVSRLARRGKPLGAAEWTNVLDEAAHRLDVRTLPRLVMSDEVDMAFAFQATSPVVIVPGSAREWSRDRRRAVLLHELAHIQRRDLTSHGIAAVVCALSWFNPLIWLAARRLRIESEMASDEIVLRAGVRPSVYAQHLLDMVTSFGRRAPFVALAMARPKEFEGRLVAILDSPRRPPLVAGRRSAVVALAALPAFAIGVVAPVPRSNVALPQPIQLATSVVHSDSAVAALSPPMRTAPPARRVSRVVATKALSNGAIAMLLRFGAGGVVNPMMMLLRDADSLKLTSAQADSIATLNRHYMIELNRIWTPVSSFYVSRADSTAPALPPPGSDPTRATIQALNDAVRDADGVLSEEQRSRLAPNVAPYLDPHALSTLVGTSPNGVFMSLDQLYSVRGRGRGGG
jgi:beta-lactamase regulating signal transducer with metallopeptidase domain